jgi:hypothetical protein
MKLFAIILSITVGILSIVYFKEHIFETASALYNNNNNLAIFFNNNHSSSSSSDNMAAKASIPRAIRKAFLAVEQAEGAGARVRRSIGTPQLKNFSPFLMLDHFSVKPGAGFPDHPHRGQEVCLFLSLTLSSDPHPDAQTPFLSHPTTHPSHTLQSFSRPNG